GHGGQVLVSTSTAALVDSAILHDLGEHRLKDLSAPERIYQLGTEEFPALKSLYRTNLPMPATPFLGRRLELAEVLALLARDDVRLLTLTGPGGTGKTRLALQAAAAASDAYPDGVFWVPLAPLHDPQLVLETAAQALGAKDGLAAHIADKRLLLLFDNFEHVGEAATDAAALLGTCPNLRLLVTTREPLHVSGEQEYPVLPLIRAESVEFFAARARAIKPDFVPDEDVPRICSRLDDLPLALELAAARTRALSSAQILDRLEQRLPLLTGGARDLPERQRTLRATIDWSYDLLDADEQRLYARLAVFRGGCALDAAERITDAELDTLQSLVDKSLLRHNEGRYWMLETIREHATERLEESGQAKELQNRHAQHFLELAEEAEPLVMDEVLEDGEEWLNRLDRELDNLRAALDGLENEGESERALRLAGALSDFWVGRGYVADGRRRLEHVLHSNSDPTAARAKALNGAAELAAVSGDPQAMGLRAEEALALHRRFGNPRGEAESLQQLGYAVGEGGDWAQAQLLLEESIERFIEIGDERFALWTTRTLAWTYAESGDRDRARVIHEDNLRRARVLGIRSLEAALLSSLSWLVEEDALPLMKESIQIRRELGNRVEIATGLCGVARVITVSGRAETAVLLISCFEALSEEIGGGESWVARMNAETLATIHTQLDEAAFAEAWERGRPLTLDQAVNLALTALDEAS
ncbi:ATP-binding protein, partial [Gaiella sp.]|uniref:ATP-binding protein n=1 Tax=Gaiella sp. TaxID=2663207 RepID=UPI0039839B25